MPSRDSALPTGSRLFWCQTLLANPLAIPIMQIESQLPRHGVYVKRKYIPAQRKVDQEGKWSTIPGRYESNPAILCTIHAFSTEGDTDESGAAIYPVVIIELPDGTILTVGTSEIKFVPLS